MVYVVSLQDRHMIGEKLQWNDLDDRQQQLGRGRNKKYLIGDLPHLLTALGRNCDQQSAASFHFLHHPPPPPAPQPRLRVVAAATTPHPPPHLPIPHSPYSHLT